MSARISWVTLLLLGTPAGAQDAVPKEHRLVIGRSVAVRLERPLQRLALGDAAFVSVVILDPKELLVSGKRPGRTNVLLWFAEGQPEERVLFVEPDLAQVREHLARIDPEVKVESTSDGTGFILSGTVPTFHEMNLVLDTATRLLEVELPEGGESLVVEAPVKGKPAQAPTPQAEPRSTAARPAVPARRVRNMLLVRELPPTLERRLEEAARGNSGGDVRVRRIPRGAAPDDALDTFAVEGTVSNQTAYTRMLAVLDRMLGGKGGDFTVVADEGGGLSGEAGSRRGRAWGTAGAFGAQETRSLQNNIEDNIGRASVLRTASDRLLSFVKVANVPQVLLSVRVLDLDRSRLRDLGVNWAIRNADFTFGAPVGAGSNLPDVNNLLSIVNGLTTNSFTVVDRKFLLSSSIRILESKGYLRTLSEPNLMALSGEVASFRVGGEVPVRIVSSTVTAALEGVEFEEFGVKLSFRPVVGEDGVITLDVLPDISRVVSINGAGLPTFARTTARTSVRLRHGEGLVVGGLIEKESEEIVDQLPLLGDIPLLGKLFGRTTKTERDRELALVVLPRILVPKPASAFALEAPPFDFPVRGGVFLDPDLGELPTLPPFRHKNVGEGTPEGEPK